MKQGEIYWLNLPKPKGSEPGYRRPCLVIQNDAFNKSKIATTVIAIITSNLKLVEAPGNVLLEAGEANLQKASVVNISQVLTINKFDLIGENRIGVISREKLDLVIEGIKLLISTNASRAS